jgi:cbb3-type cytochrome oxidase subunit 3
MSSNVQIWTQQGWTIVGYDYPMTTQFYTIFASSTPIATIGLLPASANGSIYIPDHGLYATVQPPILVEHALLIASIDKYGPMVAYTPVFEATNSISTTLPYIAPNPSTPTVSAQTDAFQQGGWISSKTLQTLPSTAGIVSITTPSVTGGASATSGADEAQSGFPNRPGSNGGTPSKLSGGARVGIAIGLILAVLLVIGIYFLFRRRHKTTRDTANQVDDASIKRASDNMVVSQDDTYLPNDDQHQEPFTFYMHEAPSEAGLSTTEFHELKADAGTSEMPIEDVSITKSSVSDAKSQNDLLVETIIANKSLHVQAQKKRELEWLEMEEARIRQRRERLMQQQADRPQA